MQNVLAGAAYFGLVFGLGFMLGTLRQLAMQLGAGRGPLVLLEIPLMLAFAWWAAGWCVRRCQVPHRRGARLLMGGVMWFLLRLGELGVGVGLMGQSLRDHFAAIATGRGLLELAPQVLAAFFPLLQLARPQRLPARRTTG
jgi:hypothetical protein